MKEYSPNQIRRYPLYLRVLQAMENEGKAYVTSKELSLAVGNSEEQVKKDIAAVTSEGGVPGKGRKIAALISELEDFLGYRGRFKAVLIGVGRLGQALLDYQGFKKINFDIVAAFDSDPNKIGTSIGGFYINDIKDLIEVQKDVKADIAVLTVPAAAAQEIADLAVKAGIKGIWNFAPVPLYVPEPVSVENVNLASSLAVLNHRMKVAR